MSIQDVYDDATVLVTGATGFVGKGFVEKVLRTCTRVRKVIVLIRIKRNHSPEQRLEQLKNDVVFDRVRQTNPGALDKLIAVHGDIGCAPNMNLSVGDVHMLRDEVNFVFHSAATVSFALPFETTSNLNIMGTKRILDLCRQMQHLKSVVYVSTAYTGVLYNLLEEQLYSPTKPIDMDRLVHVLSTGTAEEKLHEAHQYQDDHPNTYTLSKYFAEHLVDHYFRTYNLPICIVRPSMISSAHAEPTPGWISGFNGPVGGLVEPGRGATRCILGKGHVHLDLIPVDFVCNLMVVAAWWTILDQARPSTLRIYNHTTGNLQPITAQLLYDSVVKFGRRYPSRYQLLRPSFRITENRLVFELNKWLFQMIPAYAADLWLRLRGQHPMFVKIADKFNKQMDAVGFFRTHEFKFCNKNVLALIEHYQRAIDHSEFRMDFRAVAIDEYLRDVWLGVRRHLLKEENVPPPSECVIELGPIL